MSTVQKLAAMQAFTDSVTLPLLCVVLAVVVFCFYRIMKN